MKWTPIPNKPIAYMAADVIAQVSVLRRNISYYPQCSALKPPRKQLAKRWRSFKDRDICIQDYLKS